MSMTDEAKAIRGDTGITMTPGQWSGVGRLVAVGDSGEVIAESEVGPMHGASLTVPPGAICARIYWRLECGER
jgi:hypothetical protein